MSIIYGKEFASSCLSAGLRGGHWVVKLIDNFRSENGPQADSSLLVLLAT
ncbi:hypothetical protein BPAE_0056g00430 [Botrytis paeoniae]|uniref:Uncharacterized protein n=1 Tax=Botrytis paeoniae TaxID=278948 RepID=A0A4Z1FY39_9HELO|nr:hypothetical protein BPAE_0056g00430 [Botrytis paeoniae]